LDIIQNDFVHFGDIRCRNEATNDRKLE
jgi:hypothetical protein